MGAASSTAPLSRTNLYDEKIWDEKILDQLIWWKNPRGSSSSSQNSPQKFHLVLSSIRREITRSMYHLIFQNSLASVIIIFGLKLQFWRKSRLDGYLVFFASGVELLDILGCCSMKCWACGYIWIFEHVDIWACGCSVRPLGTTASPPLSVNVSMNLPILPDTPVVGKYRITNLICYFMGMIWRLIQCDITQKIPDEKKLLEVVS